MKGNIERDGKVFDLELKQNGEVRVFKYYERINCHPLGCNVHISHCSENPFQVPWQMSGISLFLISPSNYILVSQFENSILLNCLVEF